jgi:hypothetical protein
LIASPLFLNVFFSFSNSFDVLIVSVIAFPVSATDPIVDAID